ncbi:MAG: hypothetical protein Q9203_006551 [Teloschistes exilis]
MAAIASYPDGPNLSNQSMPPGKPEPWDSAGISGQENPTAFQSSIPPSHTQGSSKQKANVTSGWTQQRDGNTRPPSDPVQTEVGEKLSRNGTPSSTKTPSVNDSSYLSPPRGGKFRPTLSDGNRSGSEADSLLDLYGHPRSIIEGPEKSERNVTLEPAYHDGEDPESSRWIHRDKLAIIESHEMQEAGIKLPKPRRSKNSLRHKKSHSRNHSTTSLKDQPPEVYAPRDGKRQKVRSPNPQPAQDSPDEYDQRGPDEVVSESAVGRGPLAMYNQPHLGKSGSKIPLPRASPLPIAQNHIERSTPLPRQRLKADEEGFLYSKLRSRSNSVGSRILLDEPDLNAIPPTVSPPNGLSPSPGSPPKQRLVSKTGSINGARPKTSNGIRSVTDPQRLRTSPTMQKPAAGFIRPKSRSGLEARPATAVNRLEGDAPWIAEMYKPDPRLPPEQQMLPTHAKRLQQEQREREAREAGLSLQQQQQPPTETSNHLPERPVGITRTPSPAAQDKQSPRQQYYTPQQQSNQDGDLRSDQHALHKQSSNPSNPSSPGSSQWPLRMAPPIKPPSTTNLKKNNIPGSSPTGSTATSPADQPHGGYSTIPKVQSTPPIGSAQSPIMGIPMGMPQAMVQEKPMVEVKEKKKGWLALYRIEDDRLNTVSKNTPTSKCQFSKRLRLRAVLLCPAEEISGVGNFSIENGQLSTHEPVKQFIRNVRASKTIADERSVVQKESAAIRASFREESGDHNVRRNNVAKLLYLFTLGERTHFGQIECLKLLASPRFADKRLGYLGTMLLLDENQEVLTLVTNSLKNDLNHNNQYVVGLALCTLGNIASIEMSRDLFPEIENLLSTQNPYIRRKAALCAMRICRKVPDLQEHFVEKAKMLLSDRNHGVLLCGLTLVTSLCEADEAEGGEEGIVETFRPVVPALVRTLKGLASSGYAPEHDVTGITDPFLQVKILRLLRVLGRGDARTSEQINDILAQVATNTEASKNVGNSILYESVLTILDIEADSGLRVLGVNILGKFLTNKDNNIRYVALNTLIKVVAVEPNAVQRHRNTILECLRDPDISIRRRALDLSFTLINESNVRVLIRELLAFLEVADTEFKPVMTSQIGVAADRFAPNKRWHVDTMFRVLKLAGNHVKEQILSSFVRLIATTPDLQTYSAQKLYAGLKDDITQEGLTLAGSWVIGEYGDALLRPGNYEQEDLVKEVRESDIVDLFTNILNSSYSTQIVSEYIITSAMKLTSRLQEPAQIDRIRRILSQRTADLSVEIQQRAVEYGNLFAYDEIRRGVLERMPPPEIKEEQRVLGEATAKQKKAAAKAKKPAKQTEQDMLLDLMGGTGLPAADLSATVNGHQNNADLLADIIGGGHSVSTAPPPQSTNTNSIMDLFDSQPSSNGISSAPQQTANPSASADLLAGFSSAPQQPAPSSATTTPQHEAYNKNDLLVTLSVQRSNAQAQVTARFTNTGNFSSFTGVGLQAAVPKSQKLQLQAISKGDLEGGESAVQAMKIAGVGGALPPKLRLRLKISYTKDGAAPVTEQVDWSEPS